MSEWRILGERLERLACYHANVFMVNTAEL